MHDYLYEHQQALDDNHLEKYASRLGLDITQFNHDMASHAYAQRVREDFLSGVPRWSKRHTNFLYQWHTL